MLIRVVFLLSAVLGSRYMVYFKMPGNLSERERESMRYEFLEKIKRLFGEDDRVEEMFGGLAGELSNETAEKLRNAPEVEVVEENLGVGEVKKRGYQFIGYEEVETPIGVSDCPGINPSRPKISWKKIEEEGDMFAIQENAPWGLAAIWDPKVSEENWKSSKEYKYLKNGGTGVIVYVIDGGVDTEHPEFEGRAVWGADFADRFEGITRSYIGVYWNKEEDKEVREVKKDKKIDTEEARSKDFTDEDGHGTHVAGIIGGMFSGVAKKVAIVAVRTHNRYGKGNSVQMVKAVDFARDDYMRRLLEFEQTQQGKAEGKKWPDDYDPHKFDYKPERYLEIAAMEGAPQAVINMSLSTENKCQSLNNIMKDAENIGMHFAVSSGNKSKDASEMSPPDSPSAIAVGALDENIRPAKFSNYGKYVKLYAPGVGILSARERKRMMTGCMKMDPETSAKQSYKVSSGTSTATPHVAGAMALYLTYEKYSPQDLRVRIMLDGLVKNLRDPGSGEYSLMKHHGQIVRILSLNNLYKRIENKSREGRKETPERKQESPPMEGPSH